LILLALIAAGVIAAIGCLLKLGMILAIIAGVLWFLFTLFTLYFFRDPDANVPQAPGLVVSPGHGKVDAIEQLTDSKISGAPCHRISIFLSVIDIHVQNAPISGKVTGVTRTAGQFVSALRADSAEFNENVLIEFASTETPEEKIGLRLIAGVLARRIIPFVQPGDVMQRGDRISLIQFGSRCDIYIPLTYKIKVQMGQMVVGGESVLAAKS
jgi:phosphatidylserine decarboxylase